MSFSSCRFAAQLISVHAQEEENGGAVYSRDVDNTFIFNCIQDRHNPIILLTHHTVSTPRIQSNVKPECMQTPAQQ